MSFSRVFNIGAAFGVVTCAVRVLPVLWGTSVLDAVMVGAALGMAFAQFVNDAITGKAW